MSVLEALLGGSDKDRFARKVIGRIKARGWRGPAPEYVRQPYSLKLGGDTMFLDNAFAAWRRAVEDKDRQIDIAIGYLFDQKHDGSFSDARPFLLPAIRNRSHLTNLWLTPGAAKTRDAYDGVLEPFCDDLASVLVVDGESAMSYVTGAKLRTWQTPREEAFQAAVENLRSISPCMFLKQTEGFWISDYRDHHDAARLLLPHLFEQLDLQGRPVAVALDRAVVVVAGSADADALEAMVQLCEERFGKTDRPLACRPVVLDQGVWRPLERGEGHPKLERLRVLQGLADCAEQKALLDAHHGARAEKIYVPTLRSAVHEHGHDTWAMWMESLDSLLPQADVITFARGEGDQLESRSRYWADVEAEFGPFAPEANLYPPCYRLKAWPPDIWERIGRLPKPPWARS